MGKNFRKPSTSRMLMRQWVSWGFLVKKAADLAPLARRPHLGRRRVASPGYEIAAARVEGAADGAIVRMRDRAADRRQLVARPGEDARDRAQQGLGIGMLRRVEDLVDGAALDGAAEIH